MLFLMKTTLVSKTFQKEDENYGVNFVGTLSCRDILVYLLACVGYGGYGRF